MKQTNWPLSLWRKKCDELWYRILIARTPNCEYCGKPAVQIHHAIAKSLSAALRYDLRNGISLCAYHHLVLHAQADPDIMQQVIRQRGQEWYDYLEKNRHKIIKVNKEYYKKVFAELSTRPLCND